MKEITKLHTAATNGNRRGTKQLLHAAKEPKKQVTLQNSNQKTAYLFIIPFIVLHLIFTVFPSLYSLVLSFFNYKGYGSASFCGIKNYIRLFTYRNTWISLGNTAVYFFVKVTICTFFGFIFALLVHSKLIGSKAKRIYKPLIYLPQMCAVVACCLLFQVLFSTNNGIINNALNINVKWLTDESLMKIPVFALLVWRNVGWYFLILLTGLTNINMDLLEAAEIDGANFFNRVIKIIIPMMKPTFSFLLITEAINALKLYSEPNLVIHRIQLAPNSVAPYMNMIISQINSGNFGMASAAGVLLCVLTFVLTNIMVKGLRENVK
jgi:ABC-type sugar transport system permease subunit